MKKKLGIVSCILLLMVVAVAQVAAETTTTSAASVIYVSNVSMDPDVFYPYEEGTITVTLANSGTSAVGLSSPDILSNTINVINKDAWNTMSYIGPGSTMTYSFQVSADPPDGTYFPLFTVATKDGGSVHYPLTVKVDSTDISAAISDQPDAFSKSGSDTVNLSIINPRAGAIKNILITTSGKGTIVSPSQKYISSINAKSSADISFAVTPGQESPLTFHITYENGDAVHTTDVVMPITFGEDKTSAVPTLNNVALTSKGSYYDLTGDITNTGITDAKGLVVTVGSPAKGTETYPEYAIGSLASDDSGSFELTFTATDLSAVPLVISWKDSDGTSYTVTKTLDLQTSSGSGAPTGSSGTGTRSASASGFSQGGMGAGGPPGMGGPGGQSSTTSLFTSKGSGLSSFYPVIAGGIILIVGIVLWTKRKWLSAKLKKQ